MYGTIARIMNWTPRHPAFHHLLSALAGAAGAVYVVGGVVLGAPAMPLAAAAFTLAAAAEYGYLLRHVRAAACR